MSDCKVDVNLFLCDFFVSVVLLNRKYCSKKKKKSVKWFGQKIIAATKSSKSAAKWELKEHDRYVNTTWHSWKVTAAHKGVEKNQCGNNFDGNQQNWIDRRHPNTQGIHTHRKQHELFRSLEKIIEIFGIIIWASTNCLHSVTFI